MMKTCENFSSSTWGLAGVDRRDRHHPGHGRPLLYESRRISLPSFSDLGELDRYTPLTNQLVSIPSSIFVSAGRYSLYLVLAFVLAVGSAGYLLLHTTKNRKLVFLILGIIVVATLFCGSRGAVMYVLASALGLTAVFLWGAPWRWQQAHRMLKAIRRVFIVSALGLTAILLIFPEEAAPRVAFYMETLDPESSAFEVGTRTWDYPMGGLISRP